MSKQSLFCLIQSTNQGLYVGNARSHPALICYNFMFEPRHDSKASNNPTRVEFHIRHFAYVHPHTTAEIGSGCPCQARLSSAIGTRALTVTKNGAATWFTGVTPHLPDWAKKSILGQCCELNNAGTRITAFLTPIFIKYAKDWATNNVRAVQLVGWNIGGQDGGDPSQDTDPGLGTWQEFFTRHHRSSSSHGRESHFIGGNH